MDWTKNRRISVRVNRSKERNAVRDRAQELAKYLASSIMRAGDDGAKAAIAVQFVCGSGSDDELESGAVMNEGTLANVIAEALRRNSPEMKGC